MEGSGSALASQDARENRIEVRNVSDLWAWMNTWGELYERHEGRLRDPHGPWVNAYRQCIADLLDRLAEMGVTDCSDESWKRFTGRSPARLTEGQRAHKSSPSVLVGETE